MSSTFSLHSDFSDDELPAYEEVALPPNVTIEEREISSDDEDDYYEESEPRANTKQTTTTFASLKCFLSGSTPPVDVQKSTITFDEAIITTVPAKSNRRPAFKLSSIQTSTLQSRRNAMRTSTRSNNNA